MALKAIAPGIIIIYRISTSNTESGLYAKLHVLAEALRIPDSYGAKICNFWTFWPVIQLINHLFKI